MYRVSCERNPTTSVGETKVFATPLISQCCSKNKINNQFHGYQTCLGRGLKLNMDLVRK